MAPKIKHELLTNYDAANNRYEIGVDEAGRGPLFGRLYVAAVVLPKDGDFQHNEMKDSKKFHSKTKIKEVAEYIKTNAVAWNVQYIEADVIDEINIRQAVFRGMHDSIRHVRNDCLAKMDNSEPRNQMNDFMLLIDGNDFKPFTSFDAISEQIVALPHETIEGGDNKYTAIAAASILAKVSRDEYIADLCEKYPELVERYGLDSNMGYGTKRHLDGIVKYGITQLHRRTYGKNCKEATISPIILEENC